MRWAFFIAMDTLTHKWEKLMATPLRRADLAVEPLAQFAHWFAQAWEAELPQPHAMSLATATPQGRVSSRLVLLRSFDEAGFVFFTGLETQKVREIAANPQVALLFPWLLLKRQVRVEGTAVPLSTAQTLQFFLSRPRDSQLEAWFTQAGGVVSSRAVLKGKWAEMKEKFRAGEVPLPSGWGGFRVQPQRVEFWQGRPDGVHDRFAYRRQQEGGWLIERLRP